MNNQKEKAIELYDKITNGSEVMNKQQFLQAISVLEKTTIINKPKTKEYITQAEFAKRCGVQPKTVYNWLIKISEDEEVVHEGNKTTVGDLYMQNIINKNKYLSNYDVESFCFTHIDKEEKIKAILLVFND